MSKTKSKILGPHAGVLDLRLSLSLDRSCGMRGYCFRWAALLKLEASPSFEATLPSYFIPSFGPDLSLIRGLDGDLSGLGSFGLWDGHGEYAIAVLGLHPVMLNG